MGAAGGLALAGAMAATGGGRRSNSLQGIISPPPTLLGVQNPDRIFTNGQARTALSSVLATRRNTLNLRARQNEENRRLASRNQPSSTKPATLIGG